MEAQVNVSSALEAMQTADPHNTIILLQVKALNGGFPSVAGK
jgi:hypothetical protein